jgi:hypothetical protein
MSYLGVPIDHKTLSISQWAKPEEKFEKNWVFGKEDI